MSLVLAWLLKNWRLIAYAVAAVAVLWLLALIGHWRKDSTVRLPEAEAALKAEVDCLPVSRCQARLAEAEKAHRAINDETVRDYEKRLADIASRPVPREPVRLCRPARPGGVRVPGAAPATGTGQGAELQVEIGRDLAVELYGLADDADREALKLELLYERDVALATVPATE